MDNNIHNWGYYNPLKGNLGLQLSTALERDTKPFISNGAGFLHRDCGVSEPVSVGYMRDGWINYNRDNKFVHMLPMNYHVNYGILPPEPPEAHALQMMHSPDLPIDEKPPVIKDEPKKKRSQGRPNKQPKPKKPKKVAAPKDETKASASRGKTEKPKNTGLVINGVDLDISGFPTPVCSCTGNPQACYRWGIGGWQSACCTTNMSAHPLPMSTKRRGARIAGRKMSQGAFKKVLEKLAGEGCNLSNPIDLKAHWAKHGTNKFVTIR